MPFLILSGGTRVRTPAPLNHRVYADRLGVDYLFDATPDRLPLPFFQKFAAVRRALPHYELVFWIDDDAFVTNLDVDVRSFAEEGVDLLLCSSPVNAKGSSTYLSSGHGYCSDYRSKYGVIVLGAASRRLAKG